MSLQPSTPASIGAPPHAVATSRGTSLRVFGHRALLLSGMGLVLAGCQTTSAPVTSMPSNNGAILDLRENNAQVQRAQSAQFAKAMADNSAARQALFDTDGQMSAESAAKARLVAAIRQHMHSSSTAVSSVRYTEMPATAADSVDKGADSLYDSFIKTIAYRSEHQYDDYDDYDSDYDGYDSDYDEYDYDTEVDAEVAAAEYGDEPALAIAEVEAAEAELEASGYNDEDYDDYDDDYYYEDDEEDSVERLKTGVITDYIEMKRAEQDGSDDEGSGVMQVVMDMMKRTDAQVAADNFYQNQYVTFSSVTESNPQARTLRSVYSYDYLAPTVQSSIQLPLMLDFNNKRMVVDASAAKPLVAMSSSLFADDNQEQVQKLLSKDALVVSFGLPEDLADAVPSDVLYDSFIKALEASFAEIPASTVSDVTAQQDVFANELGASQVLKVNFDTQQSGAMLGRIIKHMSRDLQQYVEAHPELYADKDQFNEMLERLSLYNKGYHSTDAGKLMQLIEALAPLSLNQNNYYYLDRAGKLVGKQQRLALHSPFLNMQQVAVNQVRYNTKDFSKHSLTPLLRTTFSNEKGAPTIIDGNQLMKDIKKEQGYAEAARYARYDYDTFNEYDYDSSDADISDYDDAYGDDFDNDMSH